MLTTVEPKRKTIGCQILSFDDATGIALSSIGVNDSKLARVLAHYSSRGHNIYPIYEDDVVDNVTIDDSIDDNKKIKAFFVTKFALKNQHRYEYGME